MRPLAAAALLSLAIQTTACADRTRAGRIEGQMYVVLESGNLEAIGRRPVRLLPENARLDSTISTLCIRRDREVAALNGVIDSILGANPDLSLANDTAVRRMRAERAEATERAMRERNDLLAGAVLRTAQTDAESAFAFDSVPPGKYRVWSDATLESGRWNWRVPVRVRSGDTLKVSLNNSNSDDNPLNCPTPLGE